MAKSKSKNEKKYVGVRFDKKKGTSQIYYYSTKDNSIEKGDDIHIRTDRGGHPHVKVVSVGKKKRTTARVKPLDLVEKN